VEQQVCNSKSKNTKEIAHSRKNNYKKFGKDSPLTTIHIKFVE